MSSTCQGTSPFSVVLMCYGKQLHVHCVCCHMPLPLSSHALESYTALPYQDRLPRPSNPANRPAYQGSNPISDMWSLHALRMISKYFKRCALCSTDVCSECCMLRYTCRSIADPGDDEARSALHLASTYAGVGFGNAGCHLWYVILLCVLNCACLSHS